MNSSFLSCVLLVNLVWTNEVLSQVCNEDEFVHKTLVVNATESDETDVQTW